MLVDDDKGTEEYNKAIREAKSRNIIIISSNPCIEAILLAILDGNTYSSKSSQWCKSKFESLPGIKGKRIEIETFSKIMPQNLLERRRKKLPVLNKIIDLLQGV